MSKKTNAAKLQARTTKRPRKNAHGRGRKNPAFNGPPIFTCMTDPILLHHIAGFILRTLELHAPGNAGMGEYPGDKFTTPTGVTPKSEVN